jgi:hypothetical protein
MARPNRKHCTTNTSTHQHASNRHSHHHTTANVINSPAYQKNPSTHQRIKASTTNTSTTSTHQQHQHINISTPQHINTSHTNTSTQQLISKVINTSAHRHITRQQMPSTLST